MARYTGPKNKLSRREDFDLFGRGNKLRKTDQPPGEHTRPLRRRTSVYGTQLREKQKAKRLYGIQEKQFANYVRKARSLPGNSTENLVNLLESRLDNVVFRLGLSSTRPGARQLVSHGHILVNGKKINVPSYTVKQGDQVSLSLKTENIPSVKKALADKIPVPLWLERKATVGLIKRPPTPEDITEPLSFPDIFEFYSK